MPEQDLDARALIADLARRARHVAVRIHTEACLQTRFRSKEISRGRRPVINALAQRTGPTLVTWGEHDVTAEPAAIARVLADSVPGCRTELIEGAGHWAQYERADKINHLLLDWFKTTGDLK